MKTDRCLGTDSGDRVCHRGLRSNQECVAPSRERDRVDRAQAISEPCAVNGSAVNDEREHKLESVRDGKQCSMSLWTADVRRPQASVGVDRRGRPASSGASRQNHTTSTCRQMTIMTMITRSVSSLYRKL